MNGEMGITIAEFLMKHILAQEVELASLRTEVASLSEKVESEHNSSMFWYRKSAEQEKALEAMALGSPVHEKLAPGEPCEGRD